MTVTQETVALMKAALKSSSADLAKAVTTAQGLAYYDLQAPAKNLYPVITKLRNMTPRLGRPAGYGTACNWKVVQNVTGSGFDAMGWIPEGQPLRLAHFLAQIAYESGEFTRLVEDLDYSSAASIGAQWPRLAARADELVRNPVRLANAAYGFANGNRGEASGDGWMYRGRGLIQLTGRWNYMFFGDRVREDLLGHPGRAADPAVAARTALSYWAERGCNRFADADDTDGVTRRIAGAAEAVDARARLKRRALALLAA